MLVDVDGHECMLCFNCRHLKRVAAFTDRTRGVYQHADKSHHCLWCLYRAQKRAGSIGAPRRADAHERDVWSVRLSVEEVQRSLPQPPDGARVVLKGPWPEEFGRSVAITPGVCRVVGCSTTCCDDGPDRPHDSGLCCEHRQQELWEVSPHRCRKVRWCSKCRLQPASAWADDEKGEPTCTRGRAQAAHRKGLAEAPLILADADRAPDGHEWLCWHSGRADKGDPPPRRGRGKKRKNDDRPSLQLRPERWCLVRGCTWHGVVGKSEVCPAHRAAVLCSERAAGQPALWMYCATCQGWKPALGYGRDGRCSTRCRTKGSRGLKALPKSVTAAKAAATALASEEHVTASVLHRICSTLSIGRLLAPNLRQPDQCAHVSNGCELACGKSTGKHTSHTCAQHRGVVLQRADATPRLQLVWRCPCCNALKPVAGMGETRCEECDRIWSQRDSFLAGLGAMPTEVAVDESVAAGDSSTATDGAGSSRARMHAVSLFTDVAGAAARHALASDVGAHPSGAAPYPTTAVEVEIGDDPTARAAAAEVSGSPPASPHAPRGVTYAAQGEFDGNTDADAGCDDGGEWVDSDDAGGGDGAPAAGDGDPVDDGAASECCRCKQCHKPLHPGRSLDGWCVVCLATKKIGVSALALYVLAAIPGCLHKGAGALSPPVWSVPPVVCAWRLDCGPLAVQLSGEHEYLLVGTVVWAAQVTVAVPAIVIRTYSGKPTASAGTLADSVSFRGLPAALDGALVRANNNRQPPMMAMLARAKRLALSRAPADTRRAAVAAWAARNAAGRSANRPLPVGLPEGPLANAWRNTQVSSRTCAHGAFRCCSACDDVPPAGR